MQVKAIKNLIYGGEIYQAGASFDCEDKLIPSLKNRGLIASEEVSTSAETAGLPSLDEELKRKKR